MISEQYACSHSCVTRAVCAEAPSCWKVNPAGINCLQSTISLISILFTGTHELLLLLHPCSRSDCIRIFFRMGHLSHFNCVNKMLVKNRDVNPCPCPQGLLKDIFQVLVLVLGVRSLSLSLWVRSLSLSWSLWSRPSPCPCF